MKEVNQIQDLIKVYGYACKSGHDSQIPLSLEEIRVKIYAIVDERNKLASAIAEAAKQFQIYNGEVDLSGPQLLMFLDNMVEENQLKQARIDELMLEFCPEEMTKEQLLEWAKHQRVAKEQPPLKVFNFKLPQANDPDLKD